MEISELDKFFLFWSAISVIFLKLGFSTIDNDTQLSNSIPPLAMFLFKHSMAIFTCYSSLHAFLFGHHTNKLYHMNLMTNGILFILVSFLGGGCGYCFVTVTTLYNLYLVVVYHRRNFASKWQLVIYAGYSTVSSTIFVCLLAFGPTSFESYLVFAFSLYASNWLYHKIRWGKSVPPDQNNMGVIGTSTTHTKSIDEFADRLLGTIVFQIFFRFKAYKQVVGLLYLAVAWLADMTLLSPCHDLGVLNFQLGSAIAAGCVVGELGLSRKTWIAYAASWVFLYCLRLLKIQSLSILGEQNTKS